MVVDQPCLPDSHGECKDSLSLDSGDIGHGLSIADPGIVDFRVRVARNELLHLRTE